MNLNLGKNIKDLRTKRGLSQEKLAEYLKVSPQSVSKWERGVSSPDLSLIIPITKIFHISADDLLGVNDVESDKQYDELKQAYYQTDITGKVTRPSGGTRAEA